MSFSLEECLTAFHKGQQRDAHLVDAVTQRFHVLGIAVLLQDASPTSFASLLELSAQAEVYLRELDLSEAPKQRKASRSMPFSDALAAGDLGTARAIAAAAPVQFLDGWEYEDDFLEAHFQHRLLLAPDDMASLSQILERWEAVLEGAASAALDASRALLGNDAAALDASLRELMREREKKYEAWRKTSAHNPELDATEGQISVPGLALLRLAELRGIATRREYPFMPSVARVPVGTPVPQPGSWHRLDFVLGLV